MAEIGNEGGAYQLQCAISAVQPCPCTLGRRLAAHGAQGAPGQKSTSPKMHSSQKRAHPNPIKNDQKR